MGGGGFTAGSADPALDELVLRPHRRRRARASACSRPPAATPSTRSAASTRPTATACASRRTFHCSGSAVSPVPLREHLLSQDAIYVGGGSMVNLLAIWKAQGLDVILREAWQAGVLLAGLSAGSMCWFEWGVSTSSGHAAPGARPRLPPGLELRPPRQRARPPPGLPRGGPQRRDPARPRGRRRRRPDLPRHDAVRGRQRPRRRPRLRRHRGRRDSRCRPAPSRDTRTIAPAATAVAELRRLRLSHLAD